MFEAIARIDSAAGWLAANQSGVASLAMLMPAEGSAEMFADQRAVCAGGWFPPGAAVPVQGGYRITADQLAAAITPQTRWLLLNSPGNPTGATYPAAELAALGEVLARHPRVLVMSDDIYAPLRYAPGQHATLAVERPDLADRVLTVSGVSKSHAMTGFRIGVATGPRWLIALHAPSARRRQDQPGRAVPGRPGLGGRRSAGRHL